MKRPAPSQSAANLFADSAPDPRPSSLPSYRINIDGGSRGNPGPAAYGIVIRDPSGQVVARLKKYIGRTTNNVAEYYGLIAALDYAQAHGLRALRIESDSELLVNQMQGRYKVKSADLQPLFERARKMVHSFESFRIGHVCREQNREADQLANEALDEVSGRAGADLHAAPCENLRVRARYRGGVFYPEAGINLPDNAEVELLVKPAAKK
jgi:ribonuclease HI